MIKVKRLGPLTLMTPDIEGMTAYYSETIGLTVTSSAAGRVVLATQMGQEAIVLEKGQAPGVASLSFQIPPTTPLDEAQAFLDAEGIKSVRRTSLTPCIDEALTFTDAAGHVVNLFAQSTFLNHKPMPKGASPLKLGHVAFLTTDVHSSAEFYQRILGFRVSDWKGASAVFLRCNIDHHTINFFRSDRPRLHHLRSKAKIARTCAGFPTFSPSAGSSSTGDRDVTTSAITLLAITATPTRSGSNSTRRWTSCPTRTSAILPLAPGIRIALSIRKCGRMRPRATTGCPMLPRPWTHALPRSSGEPSSPGRTSSCPQRPNAGGSGVKPAFRDGIHADGPSTFVSGHCIDAFSAGVQTFRAYHCPMVISGNVDRPGGNLRMRTPKGFRSLDFVAVAAHAMTPTAEQADIVLALCRCPPALEGHLLPPRHAHDGRR